MKEPLLLLHGAISCRKQFESVIPLLASHYNVYAPDFPGHGGTIIPDESFSIPFFASFVLKYMDANKIPKALVFGYSMGGYVGLYLAAHHRDRISRVFTLATKFGWTPSVAEKESAMLDPEKISAKVPAFASRLEQLHTPQDWKTILIKTAAMLRGLGNSPALTDEILRNIDVPVCIGIGALDKMVSTEESEHAASQIPNGRFLLLADTEHPFEKADPRMLAETIQTVIGVPR
jgi:pimeloyl-ACP methyl ester carboxylesterase